MNQDKIGKLIAKLRKEKGLTQQELGEKVNVGSRAVSKWERGLTLPDISIINELSKILGITSDELLKGELDNSKEKSTNKKPFNYKPLLILLPIIIIIIVLIIFINNKDKNEVYLLKSLEPTEYRIDGKMIIIENDLSIIINKIEFQDYNFNQIKIKNYEYCLISDNKVIFGFSHNKLTNSLSTPMSIKKFLKTFIIDNKIEETTDTNGIINNNLILEFIFVDESNNQIIKNIKIQSIPKNKNTK